MTGRATSNSAAEFRGGGTDTFVGDFIGSRVTHIVWEGRDRRGWGKAACGVKGNMPMPTPTPEVSCKRCMAWARKNRPEHVRD